MSVSPVSSGEYLALEVRWRNRVLGAPGRASPRMRVGLLRLVQPENERARAGRGWPFEVVHSMMRVIGMVCEESTISLPESALAEG